jgi:hypothetical protein
MLGWLHQRGDPCRARSTRQKARDGLGSENDKRLEKTEAPSAASSHGLVLPLGTLKALQKRGIYCTPGVSLEHQHLARRYVLRGVESGGAVSDMGRACAFVAEDGSPLPWLQPIHSIAVNGRHATHVAVPPVLVNHFTSKEQLA